MTKYSGRLLIIDDDPDVLHTARLILKKHFETVHTESDPACIYQRFSEGSYDVIILDMNFSPGATSGQEGLYWLSEIRKLDPQTHVMMNTAYGDIALAVKAMREGAIDFLVKPWEKEKLLSSVVAVYQLSQSRREVAQLRSRQEIFRQDTDSQFPDIISQSPVMKSVLSSVEKVAATDASVLILGENGTGKELIARAIHRHSPRAEADFVKVDVGAIPESLFESELFGHVKGAFTDAREDRMGRFEIASGGTLFLDEIGNVPVLLQAKLLSALQNRQITRLGTNKPVPVDIRLVSATNQPLHQLVEHHTFRQDLLYRINTVEIHLPPLRERPEDIPILATHFLRVYSQKYRKPEMRISREARQALEHYHWPGNIRELQHAVERAVIMSDTAQITSAEFLLTPAPEKLTSRKESYNLEELEKTAIRNAIKKHKGNLTKAAEELGFGRSTLYRRMERYGL